MSSNAAGLKTAREGQEHMGAGITGNTILVMRCEEYDRAGRLPVSAASLHGEFISLFSGP